MTKLRELAECVRGVTGWRRALLAILFGALAALALPPFHLVPALVPAFTGLVWMLEGVERSARPHRRALWAGFWFGFGHFFFGLHWIIEPLLVDPVRTAWMIPFAWPGLAGVLALYIAAVCWVQSFRRWGVASAGRVLAIAGLWTLIEIVRGFAFTGFPWNLIGYSWSAFLPVLQTAAVIGVLGLGTLTVLMAAMPALLVTPGRPARRRWVLVAGVTVLLPVILAAGGALRMSGAETAFVPDIRLRLVQANIAQRDKWNLELRASHLDRHVAMSRGADGPPPTHVIWPETAVPFLLANDPLIRVEASRAVPSGGMLIAGSVRTAFGADGRRLYNSLLAINDAADIVQVYDKSHLVPFGEYVPFRGVLPVDKIVPGQGDFTAGPGLERIDLPDLPPFSPLICYEAIFPARVVPAGGRPGWLLNITNDAWFGKFAGPRQHFAIASARSVEEGLALVRVANTGISAVVDPYGRTLAKLGQGEQGVIDSGLPRGLAPTAYARFGDLLPAGLAFLLCVLGLLLRRPGDTG